MHCAGVLTDSGAGREGAEDGRDCLFDWSGDQAALPPAGEILAPTHYKDIDSKYSDRSVSHSSGAGCSCGFLSLRREEGPQMAPRKEKAEKTSAEDGTQMVLGYLSEQ